MGDDDQGMYGGDEEKQACLHERWVKRSDLSSRPCGGRKRVDMKDEVEELQDQGAARIHEAHEKIASSCGHYVPSS